MKEIEKILENLANAKPKCGQYANYLYTICDIMTLYDECEENGSITKEELLIMITAKANECSDMKRGKKI